VESANLAIRISRLHRPCGQLPDDAFGLDPSRQTVATQHRADRLVADRIPKILPVTDGQAYSADTRLSGGAVQLVQCEDEIPERSIR